MKQTNTTRPRSLGASISMLTLALAAIAPLPGALAPFGAVAEAHAQSNPCAPRPPAKAAPANPCAPRKASPANPCAPKADAKAAGNDKGKKKCDAPKNPCAPASKCTEDGHNP